MPMRGPCVMPRSCPVALLLLRGCVSWPPPSARPAAMRPRCEIRERKGGAALGLRLRTGTERFCAAGACSVRALFKLRNEECCLRSTIQKPQSICTHSTRLYIAPVLCIKEVVFVPVGIATRASTRVDSHRRKETRASFGVPRITFWAGQVEADPWMSRTSACTLHMRPDGSSPRPWRCPW